MRDSLRHARSGRHPLSRENRGMADRLAELTAALPPDTVLTDPDVLASYRQDWARDPDAGTPLAAVRANSTADVQVVLRCASAHRVPVVPRGGGSIIYGG